jgi:polyhydroxyalkanoate synthesis regulator phasin
MGAMDSNTAMDFFQKSVRVTLGATSALVESIQDPLKREENWAQLRLNPGELTDFLAKKGAITEVEARTFVEGVVSQVGTGTAPSSNRAVPVSPVVDPVLQLELRELTAQLAQLRSQLTQDNSVT